MWFEDLASLAGDERLVTVGWLARDRPYARGSVDPGVYSKLESLLVDPWQPALSAGFHGCELCLYTPEKVGSRNLYVPGSSRAFVTPELILHYMNAHGYRPPDEFLEAVVACPPMRSQEYRRALARVGGLEIFRPR